MRSVRLEVLVKHFLNDFSIIVWFLMGSNLETVPKTMLFEGIPSVDFSSSLRGWGLSAIPL